MKQPGSHGLNGQDTCTPDQTRLCAALRGAIGEQNYNHWFADRSRIAIQGEVLRISVPNPFISNWLLKRFRSGFSRAAASVLGPSGTFELVVDETLKSRSADVVREKPDVQAVAPATVSRRTRSSAGSHDGADDAQPLAVRNYGGRRRFQTFSSLVAGDCNDLAVMAARQVVDHPGQRFNPLYLYGPTGVGKTHLLEAIYSDIRSSHPELNVIYLTTESFTNYFTQSLSSRTSPSFRQRFRNVDVLLVDNIEFLDNKRATQEEFLFTIVQVIENGGQLVISGDRHPRMLQKHREELTTRFMSGLVCRMDPPDEETRRRIVAAYALPFKDCFSQESLDYVARRCKKNVREIQGALNCLQGHFALTRKRVTASHAREILGELDRECRRLVRISDVERVICDAFGLSAADLRSKSRRRAVSHPRALAMYVARKVTRSAYREIGMYFGGRDHSTVVAAERRVQAWIDDRSNLDLPSSCRGKSVEDVIHELEERLLSLAS